MKKIIIIAGPTASGKTSLAVNLAKKYNGEVVSADSMQIYKGMDIATAKPTEEEKQGIKHYLIDFVEPCEKFSVAEFKKAADDVIFDIISRGKLPIVAGGTGLYIDSVLRNTYFGEFKCDESYRNELKKIAVECGTKALLEKLKMCDPECAVRLHENDVKRIIRALEVYNATGVSLSEHEKNSHLNDSEYDFLLIGLFFENREKLYERINKRVDDMVDAGLIKEAEKMIVHNDKSTAYQAIGYKEFYPYFSGEVTLEMAVENLKKSTRNYAKRQITWFKRYENLIKIYVDKGEMENVDGFVRSFLN